MNKKRPLTIGEWVVIIVVIAVLAAVLIPTGISLVRRSRFSEDIQLAKELNAALAAYEESGNKIEEFSDANAALSARGYVLSDLHPTAKGGYFVWEKSSNQILLTDGERDFKVVYAAKKEYKLAGNTWYLQIREDQTAQEIENYFKSEKIAVNIRHPQSN